MDQLEQDHQYEAPVVEDVEVDKGPATVQAGAQQQQTLF
jgi:hypothetical protein